MAEGNSRQKITRGIVSLHKKHFGRGPVSGKTYLDDDSVLVLLHDGHTHAEETLQAGGGEKEVASQRVKTSDAIEDHLIRVVEEETGRKVLSFMSTSKQEPSLIAYVFVLEASEVLEAATDAVESTPAG